ncbi:Hypothetical_protein [Hexamita inflata]|uniref:Hypothetical_protein n=1 Tax=Hexamita inflata TaxID=28002 RepID=A0AA86Q0S2_9EUKA|nr:Hypothetical protein HINF_LOCUS36101 [Hexamita inflata]CAI9959676.1 Hypothetical protein HINF_LOCUS47321 [Hexamita inflata]
MDPENNNPTHVTAPQMPEMPLQLPFDIQTPAVPTTIEQPAMIPTQDPNVQINSNISLPDQNFQQPPMQQNYQQQNYQQPPVVMQQVPVQGQVQQVQGQVIIAQPGQQVYPAATNTTIVVNNNNEAAEAAAEAACCCLCWMAACRIFCCCLECLLHIV